MHISPSEPAVVQRAHRLSAVPGTMTSFVGSSEAVDRVLAAVEQGRLVTLTGPGGVGKTRVAIEAARLYAERYQDDVVFIDLSSATTPLAVIAAVSAALHARGRRAQGSLDDVTASLAGRDTLLVLDNCEQVAAFAAELVREILENSPGTRVLITSRVQLEVTGESVIPIEPLGLPAEGGEIDEARLLASPATALFIERAMARAPHLVIEADDARLVGELCRRLDGLPLAIELAAARARSLSIPQIHAHLISGEIFVLLSRGDPTAAARHQALDHVIGWSYELCTDEERTVWHTIADFAAAPSIESITAVLRGEVAPSAIEAAVDGLVAKSVITAESRSGGIRFKMLATTSMFGRSRAGAAWAAAAGERRRLYFVSRAAELNGQFWAGAQRTVMAEIHADFDNYVRAWELTNSADDTDGAYRLALALVPLWVMGGALSTGSQWLASALKAPATAEVRGAALWSASWIAELQGDVATASAMLVECRRIGERLGSAALLSHCDTWEGGAALFAGDVGTAQRKFTTAALGHTAAGQTDGLLMTLFQQALTFSLQGDDEEADAICAAAIDASKRVGDEWCLSYTKWVQSFVANKRGLTKEARALAAEAVGEHARLDDVLGMALSAEVLVSAADDPHRGAVAAGVTDTLWERAETTVMAFGPDLASAARLAREQLASALGVEAFARAVSQGRTLSARDGLSELQALATPTSPLSASGRFTLRESQVAHLLARGASNKEIAQHLVVSVRTAEGHVDNVLRKLGVVSRAQAAAVLNQEDTRVLNRDDSTVT